jgi:MarR family transcriptional regulator, lower aerobic nicotinate degradation pathway regulator
MTTIPRPSTTPHTAPSRELLMSTRFLLKRLGLAIKDRSLQAFEGSGLHPQHYAVLSLLHEQPREAQATIADALGYDRSQLVGLLDELERKGLVERRRDPDDRRRHLVSLTPAGKKTYGRLREIAKQLEEEFLAPLDAAERERLHALLLELAAYHDPRCGGASYTTD